MVDLDDWSIVGEHQTLYSAPHQQLHGRRPDGKYIRTSRIKTINGNEVTTLSGTIYKLLTPHPDYIQWCIDNNYHIPTEAEPIILR